MTPQPDSANALLILSFHSLQALNSWLGLPLSVFFVFRVPQLSALAKQQQGNRVFSSLMESRKTMKGVSLLAFAALIAMASAQGTNPACFLCGSNGASVTLKDKPIPIPPELENQIPAGFELTCGLLEQAAKGGVLTPEQCDQVLATSSPDTGEVFGELYVILFQMVIENTLYDFGPNLSHSFFPFN